MLHARSLSRDLPHWISILADRAGSRAVTIAHRVSVVRWGAWVLAAY